MSLAFSNMSEEVFHFKQFSILQSGVTWKVGFDGLLLGTWANVNHGTTILDMGTGTGLLALMAAQRNQHALIDAIEIDESSASVASQNFDASPWADRLTIYQGNVFDAVALIAKRYDVIITNPPFFPRGLKAESSKRSLARSGEGFDVSRLPQLCEALLAKGGRLNTILPFDLTDDLIGRFIKYQIGPIRRCDVRHKSDSRYSRSLLELGECSDAVETEILNIYEDGIPSQRYRELMSLFRDAK